MRNLKTLLSLSLALLIGVSCKPTESDAKPPTEKRWTKPSDEQLRARLSKLQYQVTQNAATEPPFRNAYYNKKDPGIYVDIVTGEPLFASVDKFDSGTGWPSFVKPIEPGHVVEKRDASHGMVRTEVLSKAGDSHLGHLFDDGPPPSRMRYCINSASLRFVPLSKLEAEGYGQYRSRFAQTAGKPAATTANECTQPKDGATAGCKSNLETAILAGGCFWGMEEILRKVPGVLDTEVGYTGGTTKSPTYNSMKGGHSGHAEAVKIVFDPTKISYADLLEKWFYRMHDPTTKDRQGNDVGSQYRSAIFTTSKDQARVARDITRKVDKSGKWKAPIVTQIVTAGTFTNAEDYHQDYLQTNPGGYTCHYLR